MSSVSGIWLFQLLSHLYSTYSHSLMHCMHIYYMGWFYFCAEYNHLLSAHLTRYLTEMEMYLVNLLQNGSKWLHAVSIDLHCTSDSCCFFDVDVFLIHAFVVFQLQSAVQVVNSMWRFIQHIQCRMLTRFVIVYFCLILWMSYILISGVNCLFAKCHHFLIGACLHCFVIRTVFNWMCLHYLEFFVYADFVFFFL